MHARRTPGTGLYSQLERFNLPRPEAVFSLDFFRENPHPFFTLARELFPGNYDPTPTHHFMRLLHDKGLLLRQAVGCSLLIYPVFGCSRATMTWFWNVTLQCIDSPRPGTT